MVLTAFVAKPHAPEAPPERGSHAERLPRIHVGQQHLGREIRLEMRMRPPPLGVDLVAVGVEQVRLRMLGHVEGQLRQGVRRQYVIMVQQHDEVAAGQLDRAVRRGRDVSVLGPEHQLDPRIPGKCLQVGRHRGVGTRIIGDAEFPVWIDLGEHAGDGQAEHCQVGLVDGHGDGEHRPIVVGDAVQTPLEFSVRPWRWLVECQPALIAIRRTRHPPRPRPRGRHKCRCKTLRR